MTFAQALINQVSEDTEPRLWSRRWRQEKIE